MWNHVDLPEEFNSFSLCSQSSTFISSMIDSFKSKGLVYTVVNPPPTSHFPLERRVKAQLKKVITVFHSVHRSSSILSRLDGL